MDDRYFKNIHPLLDIACQKKENKYTCDTIYFALEGLRLKTRSAIETGFKIGIESNEIGEKEGWSTQQRTKVMDSLVMEIDKINKINKRRHWYKQ